MTAIISVYGSIIQLRASNTFPTGVNLTQFADDADPFDFAVTEIAGTAMGPNGDQVAWSIANPLKVTTNLIADSDDDVNAAILYAANRVGKGKASVNDVITMSVFYPNSGKIVMLSGGVITGGMPSNSGTGAGKLKSKPYSFSFENLTVT